MKSVGSCMYISNVGKRLFVSIASFFISWRSCCFYSRIHFCAEIAHMQKMQDRNENGIFFHLRMGKLML